VAGGSTAGRQTPEHGLKKEEVHCSEIQQILLANAEGCEKAEVL
jgi:hypothetical protein